jgi:predicted GNAT family acetyltransferase
MEKVALETKADNTLAFVLYDDQKKAGEMVVTIRRNELTAEHTEMEPFYQGRGFGAKLVEGMAEYVRSHGMIVSVLCPYTYAQFNRDPEKYDDIWNRHKRPPGIKLT